MSRLDGTLEELAEIGVVCTQCHIEFNDIADDVDIPDYPRTCIPCTPDWDGEEYQDEWIY